MTTRLSWLDTDQKTPLIDEYTQKLTTLFAAMADGQIDDDELEGQEKRLVALLKEVEPTLNDAQHDKITRLLCELTAFNVMQTMYSLQSTRPATKFQG